MKMLLWLVVIWLVAMWFLHQKKLKANRAAERMAAARENATASSAPPKVGEAMLPCAHCGLFLPRSEAITSPDGSLAWCCEEHRQRHPG